MTARPPEMQRVCLQLQVDPARIEDYRQAHAAVWPEMLEALRETGWHNYSIFLRRDGQLTLYFETPSVSRALTEMAKRDVNVRWGAAMDGRDVP